MATLTLALYNTYDTKRLHEAHLRAIARAAPIAHAYGFHLALVGFPLEGKPVEIAEEVSGHTTIGGDGGESISWNWLGQTSFTYSNFPRGGVSSPVWDSSCNN